MKLLDGGGMSITCSVVKWSAWAPSLDQPRLWREWAAANTALPDGYESPDVSFLPPMQRRRLSRLSKMAVFVAQQCLHYQPCRTIFACRHGDILRTVDILRSINQHQGVSPTAFSLSVHNAVSGLFSIANKDTLPSSSLAAGKETFACGWLEAMSTLAAGNADRVLLVYYDENLSDVYRSFADEQGASLAVAFVLTSADSAGGWVSLEIRSNCSSAANVGSKLEECQAVQFMRFFLVNDTELEFCSGSRCWRWQKHGSII